MAKSPHRIKQGDLKSHDRALQRKAKTVGRPAKGKKKKAK
jgi:hypothetical protein